jgi:hypothetical protein
MRRVAALAGAADHAGGGCDALLVAGLGGRLEIGRSLERVLGEGRRVLDLLGRPEIERLLKPRLERGGALGNGLEVLAGTSARRLMFAALMSFMAF